MTPFVRRWIGCVLAIAVAGCVGNRPPLQSNEVLDRDQQTETALVKHILIGWRELARHYDGKQDKRASQRDEAEAKALIEQLLGQLRDGTPIEALMVRHSEDPGSQGGGSYEVTVGDSKEQAFRRLSLRLEVGELGVVRTRFGWHIVKRIR